ncbi:IS3 family transposase [Terrihalobacillus insolitus]|uniref:IS3 family transposase n=1 Tax=Terrihalobacillus insolitus TaxID=2950438 RepID=UPI003A95536D
MEGFFSHFKEEAFYPFPCKTVKEAYQTVAKYIQYYNTQRYQKRFNNMTPAQYFNVMIG